MNCIMSWEFNGWNVDEDHDLLWVWIIWLVGLPCNSLGNGNGNVRNRGREEADHRGRRTTDSRFIHSSKEVSAG